MGRWPQGVVLIGALAGCGAEEDQPQPPACTQVDGVCVGVPVEPLCEQELCTDGAGCTAVHAVTSDAELDTAIAGAEAGACIALAPGIYKAVVLPNGVSLLGRSAAEVKTGALTLASGSQVRGLEVSGGITVGSATDVAIEAVRVRGGIASAAGASLTVTRSEILGSETLALEARDPVTLRLEGSIVSGAKDGGLWVQCDAGCACAQKPDVTVDHVLFAENQYASVVLLAARATLSHVRMLDTGIWERTFEPGGALSVSECSELSYAKLYIGSSPVGDTRAYVDGFSPSEGHKGFGMLIHASSASPIGSGLEEKGIIIINGMPGLWIQATGGATQPEQSVVLDGLEVQSSQMAGIGFDLSAKGIIIINGRVGSTLTTTVPVLVAGVSAGVADLGMGLVWNAGCSASIDGLELSASGTHSFLIDGAVGADSAVDNLVLSGGDELRGVVQQGVQDGDAAPIMGPSAPALIRTADLLTGVPEAAQPPAALE